MPTYKKIFIIILLIFTILKPAIIFSKELKYIVSDIPEELRKNAKAVIRNHDIRFEVKAIDHAIMDVTYVITILNENGIDNSYFIEFYDKFIKVGNIKAVVYKENGEKLKRIPLDELQDYSAISGYSIYEDNRVKFIDPEVKTTPFTVEYSYQVNFKGLLYYPNWILYDDYNISIEKSRFQAIIPNAFEFRYLEKNLDTKVNIKHEEGITTYTWDTTMLYAIKEEPYCVPKLH